MNKKVLSLALLGTLLTTSCDLEDVFKNPGDYLGGGKTASKVEESVVLDSNTDLDIDLNDLKNQINSVGVDKINEQDEKLSIKTDGSYVLEGTYNNGIEISVGNDKTVHLFLNGVTINNDSGIAISNTNKKSNVIITVVENTENYINNNGDDCNAIHVKGNLSINGSGKLIINANKKTGIKVSKSLQIVDSTIQIISKNHGISARNLDCENASFTINSDKDGLNAECDDDTTSFPENYSEGYIKLKNCTINSTSKGDGMQADTLVYINGGNYDIKTSGEFVSYSSTNMTNYELTSDDYKYIKNGSTYKRIASDYNARSTSKYALAQSCKGIKVGEISYEDENNVEQIVSSQEYLIDIEGNPTFNFETTDDALHTNSGNLLIENGTFTINTLDDAFTSDYLTQINDGSIEVQSCYEGIEGSYVKINGGDIYIVSNDDGINAASDNTSIKEYIIINDGNIIVNSKGDGIDSNGSIEINGGDICVYGPTSGADAGLDADNGILVNGGNLFVSSSLGMVETPASNSTQYIISFAQNTSISSNTEISVKDESDNTIVSVTTQKNCQSIIISSDKFEKNKTYYIYGNDTKLGTFKISSIITSIGSSTSINTQPGGGMGPGGQGGGFNPGGFNRR